MKVDNLTCPLCGSHDVDCSEKPHRHTCLACGYDGRSKISTAQIIASERAARDAETS